MHVSVWEAHGQAALSSGDESLGDYIMGRWMDREAGLNAVANRKVFALTGNRITFTHSAYNTCAE